MAKLKTRTRYKIIGSDFSAQEPRLTAHMSQDPAMIQAYAEGKDLYCVIAQAMYDNAYEENLEFYPAGTEIEIDGHKVVCGNKTHTNKAGKARRSSAKTLLLAMLYGMSTRTAAARMGKPPEEGQKLFENFFTRFPEVKKLIEGSKQMLVNTGSDKKSPDFKNGYVTDWAGRRRHLPDMFLDDYEAHYDNEAKRLEANFNPIIGCVDRPLSDAVLRFWVDEATKVRGNKQFNALARLAADGYRSYDPVNDKNTPSYKRIYDMFNERASKEQYHSYKYDRAIAERDRFKNLYDIDPQVAMYGGVILSANTGRKAQAERQCLNARIQGGAASLTKLAMVNVANDQQLKDWQAKLIITVHDEVLVEAPALYAEQVTERLPKIMIDTATPYISVPMKCDPYCVDRWYADTVAVTVQEHFKKLTEKGLTHDEALTKLCEEFSEFSRECMEKSVSTGCDLDF